VQLTFHSRQAVAAIHQRVQIDFKIKERYLVSVMWINDTIEHILGHGGRSPGRIDQKKLLFGPYPSHARLDHPFGHHLFERSKVVEQMPYKRTEFLRGDFGINSLYSHQGPP